MRSAGLPVADTKQQNRQGLPVDAGRRPDHGEGHQRVRAHAYHYSQARVIVISALANYCAEFS
jgi:hypothetical protein